ncbi:hypothetical protein BACINT_04794 [Bacteroides intestinalis DSM 17393]|uniref:Uncharacterized protein n=1 Tax=Bacteroides intestinalis DSM 17393 TaxID=471870 RepID=B3CI96_9BACE|nr:hypothetical protein BACINT_04794 [Bacteroides intestinalis DSM 17393]
MYSSSKNCIFVRKVLADYKLAYICIILAHNGNVYTLNKK